MTIFPPRPSSFTCAICTEHQDWSTGNHFHRWGEARESAIPPVCRSCEKAWGKAIGGWGDLNRDRRITRQISALAEALQVEAYRISHGEGPFYGRA